MLQMDHRDEYAWYLHDTHPYDWNTSSSGVVARSTGTTNPGQVTHLPIHIICTPIITITPLHSTPSHTTTATTIATPPHITTPPHTNTTTTIITTITTSVLCDCTGDTAISLPPSYVPAKTKVTPLYLTISYLPSNLALGFCLPVCLYPCKEWLCTLDIIITKRQRVRRIWLVG